MFEVAGTIGWAKEATLLGKVRHGGDGRQGATSDADAQVGGGVADGG